MRPASTRLLCCLASLVLAPLLAAPPAHAQADRCPKLVAQFPGFPAPQKLIIPATHQLVAAGRNQLSLTYIGHSTFLIETARGVTLATDYNDYVRPALIPRIATMNRAHSTHYTLTPDPGVEHVLKGWSDTDGEAVRHDLEIDDLWVGNLPTNIRDWEGGTIRNGNSIFVFRAADLCIAHLGHLHHTLTDEDIGALGRIDVVLAPVDGSYTIDIDGMVEILKALESPLVIPMHYFNEFTLGNFLSRLGDSRYEVRRQSSPTLILSRDTLPVQPTVLVMPAN